MQVNENIFFVKPHCEGLLYLLWTLVTGKYFSVILGNN